MDVYQTTFNEIPCGTSGFISTKYKAKIGYEARPEW